MGSFSKIIIGVTAAVTKPLVNEEEFEQIKDMFSKFINRMDGLIDDVKEIKDDLKEVRSDMQSLMGVYEDGFRDIKQSTGEIHKNLDEIIVAIKR